ncbi:MAG: hypothetical protein ACYCUM_12100 [Solirubrobacteraceae bacterium]
MSPTVAEPPIPREAFEQHPGQWVAVRGATVVAWADALEELTSKPEVADTDTLAHVPDPSTHFYRFYRCRG